jgi:hypothetical protein
LAKLVVLTLRMRKARWELASLREDEKRLRDDQDAVHRRLVRLNAAAKDLERSVTGPSPPREEM